MNWVFCDLDCTLIDTREMVITGGPEPVPGTPAHDLWLETVTQPAVLAAAKPVESILNFLYAFKGDVVFLTNRRTRLSDLTLDWLKQHNLYTMLIMRPENELSRAGEFKEKVIKQYLSKGDTCLVIDDDQDGSMEAACRRNQWSHLKLTTY